MTIYNLNEQLLLMTFTMKPTIFLLIVIDNRNSSSHIILTINRSQRNLNHDNVKSVMIYLHKFGD